MWRASSSATRGGRWKWGSEWKRGWGGPEAAVTGRAGGGAGAPAGRVGAPAGVSEGARGRGSAGGPGQRRRREGARTSRGFRRRRLCLAVGPRGRTHGSREESPKEERDPEHLDHHAARGEGPRTQPHCARPAGTATPGRGRRLAPGRAPSRCEPTALTGVCSGRRRTGSTREASGPGARSAEAPHQHFRRAGPSPRPQRGPAHSKRPARSEATPHPVTARAVARGAQGVPGLG